MIKVIVLLLVLGACSAPGNETSQESQMAEPVEQWLTFAGDPEKANIVLVSGDEEYRSEEALPQMAKILSQRHGFNCTVLFAQDPERPGIIDPNYVGNIPGLESLDNADLMILFTRFRALPDEQMAYINNYLASGKPVLGIRTSTHAFMFEEADFESSFAHYGSFYEEENEWKGGFGRLVLGEKWISHHGEHGDQSTKGFVAPDAEGHPILTGISDGDVWGPTDVYGVRLPLPGDSKPLILGQVTERVLDFDENDPRLGMRPTDSEPAGTDLRENDEDEEVEVDLNDPMMPVAWTKSYQIPDGTTGKVFASTIGSSTDLLEEGTRRLMVNGVYWLLDLDVPEKADVAVVGNYSPSRFAFYDDDYWDEKNMKIADQK